MQPTVSSLTRAPTLAAISQEAGGPLTKQRRDQRTLERPLDKIRMTNGNPHFHYAEVWQSTPACCKLGGGTGERTHARALSKEDENDAWRGKDLPCPEWWQLQVAATICGLDLYAVKHRSWQYQWTLWPVDLGTTTLLLPRGEACEMPVRRGKLLRELPLHCRAQGLLSSPSPSGRPPWYQNVAIVWHKEGI